MYYKTLGALSATGSTSTSSVGTSSQPFNHFAAKKKRTNHGPTPTRVSTKHITKLVVGLSTFHKQLCMIFSGPAPLSISDIGVAAPLAWNWVCP